MDSCLEGMLDDLAGKGYEVVVRPHPQQVRLQQDKMDRLKERYAKNPDIDIQTDFSSNSTVFEADLLVTDWSGIAYEYAFTTKKPVLFVDTPMKVMNPEYQKIDTVPINIWMRDTVWILQRQRRPKTRSEICWSRRMLTMTELKSSWKNMYTIWATVPK